MVPNPPSREGGELYSSRWARQGDGFSSCQVLTERGDPLQHSVDVVLRHLIRRRKHPPEEVGATVDRLKPDHGAALTLHRRFDPRRHGVDGVLRREMRWRRERAEHLGYVPEAHVGTARGIYELKRASRRADLVCGVRCAGRQGRRICGSGGIVREGRAR